MPAVSNIGQQARLLPWRAQLQHALARKCGWHPATFHNGSGGRYELLQVLGQDSLLGTAIDERAFRSCTHCKLFAGWRLQRGLLLRVRSQL